MTMSTRLILTPDTIGAEFVARNRPLAVADTLEAWRPAAQEMRQFIDAVAAVFASGEAARWAPVEASKIFSVLLTLLAECGQYRHETFRPSSAAEQPKYEMLTQMLSDAANIRQAAIGLAKQYLSMPVFAPLKRDIASEIFPVLDQMDTHQNPDRFMPFRVIHVGNIAERLNGFCIRTQDAKLCEMLKAIYDRKYLRFGTSGVRGRWGRDFTEQRARQVVQAICDFLNDEDIPRFAGAENLRGKRLVIAYDSRLNARTVASWVAEVCLANGFTVDFAYRDTPTPAAVFYLTDHLDPQEVAGLINCTASHNPPEWQGIKFNPRLGYPAPTNVTDFIAARINEIQLTDRALPAASLAQAEKDGRLRGFDPIDLYVKWVMNSGNGNQRIEVDFDRIRKYFADKLVVVDEMHGASRGYLSRLLGEIGIRHTVIHPETDPTLPGLDYANPEEPFINGLKAKVAESGAALGLGMDTDADRFGVVDRGGVYFRPNQILPMLVRYLGVDRSLTGRVIATQTGSPLIEQLAAKMRGNDDNKPESEVIPAYVDHPFYHRRLGARASRVYKHTFMVPVGIKYIEEQRRTDRKYKGLKTLPDTWRDALLIGGEESSGLTTRGHVTDKDGVWANLLIMDMLAYYGARPGKPLKSVARIWQETCAQEGCWVSYGGREPESNAGRADVDAILEAKEDLINFYLDSFNTQNNRLAGLEVVYAGGVRYDIAELQLRGADGDDRHYLRVRSSGTEPINRIYVESSNRKVAQRLMKTVLNKLEELLAREVRNAKTEWRLVDILTVTKVSERMAATVRKAVARRKWAMASILAKLTEAASDPEYLEGRNRRMTREWIKALS
jgi:phosphomannomutase